MYYKNNNCSPEFNEELRKRSEESHRYLNSVLDPSGAEIVERLGPAMSEEELDAAIQQEAERLLGRHFLMRGK